MSANREQIIQELRSITLISDANTANEGIPRRNFSRILFYLLEPLFSEQWYKERYPDVSQAIDDKHWPSGLLHYCTSGIYEGRLPFPVQLDEDAYLYKHPDVQKAVVDGKLRNATEHFVTTGFAEGREFKVLKQT